ncbi:MAG: reverse gyrase, partial [Candidatus Aenigmarchaeota archaeon]|nr:reverse gyrase [Candidatus Aenigmarchaeota archaeon]
FFEKLTSGDFDILITTSRFLSVHFKEMKQLKFDLIFVDDVDAVLKSSKNIDKILQLIGVSTKEISIALNIIRLKKQLMSLRYEKVKQRIFEKIEKLEKKLEKLKGRRGILIVSTATGKARGERVKLFREILNFTVGYSTVSFRNVVDFYDERPLNVKEKVLNLVRLLGSGGLVFVGIDNGSEFAEEIAEYLKENGIKAEIYVSGKSKPEILKEFSEGKLEVLVGVASYYGMLVRGLDLPHVIRYAIFTSVPSFKFSLKFDEVRPFRLYVLLTDLVDYMPEDDRKRASELVNKLRDYVINLEREKLERLTKVLEEGREDVEFSFQIRLCKEAAEFLRKVFEKKEFIENLEKNPYFSIRELEGQRFILIPDVRTYIQASGRTSRLFAGGITKGISIVLVDDEKVFRGLERQLRWYFEESKFLRFSKEEVKRVLKEVDRDRELVRKIVEGKIEAKFEDPVKSALLIVESPHKAETIANFFGRPSRREVNGLVVYEVNTGRYSLNVVASKGHILDLVENKGFYGVLVQNSKFIPIYGSIKKCPKCNSQFVSRNKCPKCGNQEILDAKDRIEAIREIASEVDMVFLGTDPDTEGEKISWDLFNIVKSSSKDVKRLEFHEVTRRAIKEALENFRNINENLVNAQIVRRIEDRWLGFKLSEIVQKRFRNRRLSGGRVQTPVLGWIIERYEEFKKSWIFVTKIELENGQTLEFEFKKNPKEFVEKLRSIGYLEIVSSELKEKEINPLPPFTTDSLLTEASRQLRSSAQKTMQLAQTLFEAGLITYHRTDSIRVSKEGIKVAEEYIRDRFSQKLFKARKWAPKDKGAHECIRPVRPIDAFELKKMIREGVVTRGRELTLDHFKLYDLIFKRFVASQMKSVKVRVQKIRIKALSLEKDFEQIIGIIENGFDLVFPIRTFEPLGRRVKIRKLRYARVPKVLPYTQGEIIRKMRERGIGRPSTYAAILQKLLDRKYVIEKKGKLIPSKLGVLVYNFLKNRFGELVSEEKTRELEKKMDMVEEGYDYQRILREEFQTVFTLKNLKKRKGELES